MLALIVFCIAVALGSLALAAIALAEVRRLRGAAGDDVPPDVVGLRGEVAALRQEAAGALRHLAVVRYDAFDDMGGRLSWSLALLDDGGDGVVLTSIRGRAEARTYAKSIAAWRSEQELSPEETEAITHAQP